jgi:hypothetical protein
MKARVWTFAVKPGQVAEVQRAYAAHMAHTRGRKGFQHSFLLTNAGGGPGDLGRHLGYRGGHDGERCP